jgi:lipopolysaccharide transport system ATP-binding protein
MSNRPTIEVRGLSKQYRLGAAQVRHNTLRDAVADMGRGAARALGLRVERPTQDRDTTFWALRDVSFDVQPGEVLGVIGANGAGKSTLLKILSRITEPTRGTAVIRGRVGSLLEVGTGFHSELTGRENTYLSGAILGMRRSEIERNFDEIVAFAEIERFIDTPVKHYSSGMYLRLAFAVAAHLEPEILIVDEVLAVGDVSFQRKCLGKMDAVARGGRTVIFVSHNMEAVRRLCSSALHLSDGSLVDSGETTAVVTHYLSAHRDRLPGQAWMSLSGVARVGRGGVQFSAVRYSSLSAERAYALYPCGPAEFEVVVQSDKVREIPSLAVTFRNLDGLKLVNADTLSLGEPVRMSAGLNLLRFRIDGIYLLPGVYTVGFWAADAHGEPLDHIETAFEVEIVGDVAQRLGATPASNGWVPCQFRIGPVERIVIDPLVDQADESLHVRGSSQVSSQIGELHP